jgi:hypothetical protein
MPTFIPKPTVIEAAGNKPKLIEEFFGRVNSGTTAASIARMRSPGGWVEPGQTPEFDEYTVVLRKPGRGFTRPRASGCSTARRIPAAPNIWPSACPPSRPAPCIGIVDRAGLLV